VSAAQVAGGTVLRFPGGGHVTPVPTTDELIDQAREWHRLAQLHHFQAGVALARGDVDLAVQEMTHERGKLDQALAIAKEARGLPRGKRQLELAALQLVLGAASDALGFLPGATADATARSLEDAAERIDNVQSRLLTLAEGFRLNAAGERDEASE
jgi:hypothetical protein